MEQSLLVLVLVALVGCSFAQDSITFYEHGNFRGRSWTYTCGFIPTFAVHDEASSVIVNGNSAWQVFEHEYYEGARVYLRPGRYPNSNHLPGNDRASSCRRVGASDRNRLRLYEHSNFKGKFRDIVCSVPTLRGFNDKASSARVYGSKTFTLFEHGSYAGLRVTLGPGSYEKTALPGGNDKVSSVRAN